MARPKPNVLLRLTDDVAHRVEEVLEAYEIYAVYYKNKPINLKWSSQFVNDAQPKYRKTIFPSKAHAANLAKRLNKQFETNDFTVVKLEHGAHRE